jgi:hypothetical protein
MEPFEMCSQLAATIKDAEECGWFLFPNNTVDHSEIKGKHDYYEHPLPTSRFILFGETPEGEVIGYRFEDDEEYRYVTKLQPTRKPLKLYKLDLNGCRARRQLVFRVYGKGPSGTGWRRQEIPELEKEAGGLASILNAFFHAFRTTGTIISYRATGKANNAKRIKRGQAPVFSWNMITLQRREIMKAEHQGGTHASPCLHERCGHWRTYKKSGKKVWIKPTMVGSIENGRRSHMYTFKEAR